jgi:hypothetical protein
MPRATTKAELKEAAKNNFEKMFALIEAMSDEQKQQEFAFEGRDRNVRDVLVHLYEWHQLLLHWVRANVAGERRDFLPAPYNWKTYPQMNVEFWEKHQGRTSLEQARTMLEKSHAEVLELIDGFSDEELFAKKYFPWTGTTSLGSYAVSATASHYDWAMKKLKEHKKTL